MVILDEAGSVLPPGLQFLKPAWWLLHVIVAALIYSYGFRKGRAQERSERKTREHERGGPPHAA
jgi:hypothetical protein